MTDDLADTLAERFEALPSHWIVMLETSSDTSAQIVIQAIKHLTEDGSDGIILEASRPCTNVFDRFKEQGVDTDKVFILDAVCGMSSGTPPPHDNVIHLESSSAFTDISITLDKVLDSTSGDRFVFIDSLSSFLIHNDEDALIPFIHRIFNTLRMNDVNGIVLTVSDEIDSGPRSSIAQLCDKVMKV